MNRLTAERLREVLTYNPETGSFTRLITAGGQLKGATVYGCSNGKGYLQLRIDGIKHRAHKLAWIWMTGSSPLSEIDHINGIKSDNRWVNIRLSNRTHNLQNLKKAYSRNSTGMLGVSVNNNGYVARINVDGEKKYLGYYKTPEEAHQIYIAAKRQLHEGNTL